MSTASERRLVEYIASGATSGGRRVLHDTGSVPDVGVPEHAAHDRHRERRDKD